MRAIVLLLCCWTGVAMSADPVLTDAGDWRAEADRRIDACRRGDFTVTLRAADGSPLAHTPVALRLVRHRFLFGMAVTPLLCGTGRDADRYRRFVLDHFNAVVCENQMKWYHVERERGQRDWDQGDALLAFAEQHRLAMRGHCLLWGKAKFVQPWAQALDRDGLAAAVDAHLQAVMGHWRGRLVCWDGINELLDGPFFRERLGPDADAALYRRAHEIDPHTPLFVNEYAILDNDEKLERYCRLIEDLRAHGAVLGGIGVQEHAAERFAPDAEAAERDADRPERQGRGPLVPRAVWRRLDRLGAYGLPIHLTEISAKTDDEQRRADTLEMLFRTAFAHERVEAILLWGFWAKAHWLGRPAALVDAQWNLLPAGERIGRLLNEEWTTVVHDETDAAGAVRFRGFHGTYAVTARPVGGPAAELEVEFGPDRRDAAATLAPEAR